MVNLTALQNIPPLVLNTTALENIEETIPQTIEIANTTTGGAFGLWISVLFFVIVFLGIFKKDGDIRLDVLTSLFISFGLTTMVLLILSVTSVISSIKPLLWFFTLFLLLGMLVQHLRSKNKL